MYHFETCTEHVEVMCNIMRLYKNATHNFINVVLFSCAPLKKLIHGSLKFICINACTWEIIADIMHNIATYTSRGPKKQICLEEPTGIYRERACVWCMKVAGEVILCCRWNRK